MMKFYRLNTPLLVLFCVGLFACSSTQTATQSSQATINQVDTTVAAYLKHHPTTIQNLQANGIQLLQLGDYDRFVIPSTLLFDGMGNRIKLSSYPLLGQIIGIIKTVPKESITIHAYTFDSGSDEIAVKLTNLQAQAVSDYLMSQGVDARLIYSVGMGELNQVTASPDRFLENYRIEITLEELKTRISG